MDGFDIITDSYSAEVISLMVLERAWAKWHGYQEEKHKKAEEDKLKNEIAELHKKIDINTALDRERHGKA